MTMKVIRLLAAFFLVLAVTGTAWAETVKVGVILPYSGPNAQLGQQVDRGFELYQKLNAKGTGGHKIEIIKRDSTGPKPDVAKRLATELITRDKVDIVAGVVYSNNAFAISDVTRKAKVPLLIMNAGTAAITTRSPYTARVSFTMWQAAYPLGKYAYEKMKIRTAAVAYANYSPGKDSKNAFTKAFTAAGGKVVADIPFPFPKIPDFTPFLQSVKDAKPDALYVFIPAGKWATGVMKTYDDLGMRAAGIELIGPGDITQDSELPNMGQVPLGRHHHAPLLRGRRQGREQGLREGLEGSLRRRQHAGLLQRSGLGRYGGHPRGGAAPERQDRRRKSPGRVEGMEVREPSGSHHDRPRDPGHRPEPVPAQGREARGRPRQHRDRDARNGEGSLEGTGKEEVAALTASQGNRAAP